MAKIENKKKSKWSFVCFLTMVISFVILLLLGLTIIKTAWYGTKLVPTKCTVLAMSNGPKMKCACTFQDCVPSPQVGCGCQSTFPCLRILISYYEEEEGVNITSMLYSTEKELFKHSRCSLTPCLPSSLDNAEAVIQFVEKNELYPGKKIQCLHVENGRGEVMLRTTIDIEYAKIIVANGIVWPALGLLISFISVLVLSRGDRVEIA